MEEFSVNIRIDKDIHKESLTEALGGKPYVRFSISRDGTEVIKSALLDETQIVEPEYDYKGDLTNSPKSAQDLAQDIYDAHDPAAAETKKTRESKLSTLRDCRKDKFDEADNEIRKHDDGDTSAVGTAADWKQYRIDLRNVTDSYKNYETDSQHATDLDALDPDSYSWPTKPS